jgi:hypothetical protein
MKLRFFEETMPPSRGQSSLLAVRVLRHLLSRHPQSLRRLSSRRSLPKYLLHQLRLLCQSLLSLRPHQSPS